MSVYPASKKQLKYIDVLVKEIKRLGERVPDDLEEQINRGNLLNAEAVIIIDDLKELLGWCE